MGLFDLLTGKSQQEAPGKNVHPIEGATTPEEFLQVFLAESDVHLRKEFIKKVTDQSLLAKIIESEKDSNVRLLGIKHLTNQEMLYDLVLNESVYKIRTTALWQLTDLELLEDVVDKCDNKFLVESAKERVGTLEDRAQKVAPKPIVEAAPPEPKVVSHDAVEEQEVEEDASIFDELPKNSGPSVEQRLISDLENMENTTFAEASGNVETDDEGVMTFSSGAVSEEIDEEDQTITEESVENAVVAEEPVSSEPEVELSDEERKQIFGKVMGDAETPLMPQDETEENLVGDEVLEETEEIVSEENSEPEVEEPVVEQPETSIAEVEEEPIVEEPVQQKSHTEIFMEMYKELGKFKAAQGNCNVPIRWKENRDLALWVSDTRKNKDLLDPAQYAALDELGFDWSPFDTLWETRFAELEKFKVRFNHCNVPKRWEENRPLGEWIILQRIKKEELSQERIARLNDLGFEWDPLTAQWETMFKDLENYYTEHYDCNVPARWKENLALGTWVSTQRKMREKLSMDRVMRLNNLNFDWEPHNSIWEKRFLALECYKFHYGNSRVPDKWSENPELANWVAYQRRHKKRIDADRIGRLDAIGFYWGRKS